ncbi:VG15 protein [Streptomyces sp. NPDC055243]|uniref:VG15 protein n=1 Tax=Streptomyces sp. NPDC055243 TaxID=3365720 RepID=UPI0037D5169B
MATLVSDDDAGANRQRRVQRGLTRFLVRDMRTLRRLIRPQDLEGTVPDWIEAVRALVAQYGNASATAAADFYDAERVAARVTGRFTVPLLDAPPDEKVNNSLRWATKDLWPRDPDDPSTTEAQLQPLDVRLEAAEKKAEAVAQKLVTDQGRGTVQEAVRQDRMAAGYARAAALGACAFCRMLSSRGMVYKQDTAGFRAHDGCNCGVIPVFRGQRFELSTHAREWDRLYREFAAPYPGDQLRRFRRAIAEHG